VRNKLVGAAAAAARGAGGTGGMRASSMAGELELGLGVGWVGVRVSSSAWPRRQSSSAATGQSDEERKTAGRGGK
jgi:hypothetical protein